MNTGPRCVGALLLLPMLWGSSKGQPDYDIRTIPAGLRIDAPAILREYSRRIEIINDRVFEDEVLLAYTVYEGAGRHFGEFSRSYDRFSSIKDLDGTLFDASGKKIRSLSGSDVEDESNISVISLYDDVRVRSATLYHDEYPYTVEFTYRVRHHGTINFPQWVSQPGREAVVHASLEIIVPEDDTLRYWTNADSVKPAVVDRGSSRHLLWQAHNLPELPAEALEEDIEQRSLMVKPAPRDFEIGSHPGSMLSWKAFGGWVSGLFQGKANLPAKAKQEVASLVAGASDVREKAMRLYRYEQERTRYVNVTLGIGGWEPYDATYVYQRGYGDCKALSNFLVALLAEAGIPSYPAVIDAGGSRSDVIESFPSNEFNHVIVCVPLQKDSLWFECTSPISPAGYLSSFTENRPALLLTREGGVMVRSPGSASGDNVTVRTGRINLRRPGDARAVIMERRTGNRADGIRATMTYGTKEEQEHWFLTETAVAGATLLRVSCRGIAEHSPEVQATMEFDMPHLASFTGQRLFFLPNLVQRNGTPPGERRMRKSPVRFSYPRVDIDTMIFALPGGMKLEAVPRPVNLEASFGSYISSAAVSGDSVLVFTRKLEIRQSEIPAARYPEYVRFFQGVVRADNAQVVLVNRQ